MLLSLSLSLFDVVSSYLVPCMSLITEERIQLGPFVCGLSSFLGCDAHRVASSSQGPLGLLCQAEFACSVYSDAWIPWVLMNTGSCFRFLPCSWQDNESVLVLRISFQRLCRPCRHSFYWAAGDVSVLLHMLVAGCCFASVCCYIYSVYLLAVLWACFGT